MCLIKILFITLFLAAPLTNSLAGVSESKGMASIVYKGWGGPKSTELNEALRLAKIKAVERFITSAGTAKSQNYERVKEEINSDIDNH